MKTEQVYTSRRHKILCVIALAGLFACGLMIGIIMSSKDGAVKYDERIEIAKENNVIADKKTESIKKIFENRKELPKPYIPNKLRNTKQELNEGIGILVDRGICNYDEEIIRNYDIKEMYKLSRKRVGRYR